MHELDGLIRSESLAESQKKKDVNALFKLVCQGRGAVRRLAVEALSRVGAPASKAAIEQIMEDESSSKKKTAIDDIAAQIILENWLNEYNSRV